MKFDLPAFNVVLISIVVSNNFIFFNFLHQIPFQFMTVTLLLRLVWPLFSILR